MIDLVIRADRVCDPESNYFGTNPTMFADLS